MKTPFRMQLNFTGALHVVNIEHTEADKRAMIPKMERDGTVSSETGANLRAHIDWNKPRRPLNELADEVANSQRI